MTTVVFLNGPPGCGKDTVAEMLWRHHGFSRLKFAQPLRNACCGLLDVYELDLEGLKARDIAPGVSLRDLMIGLSEDLVKPLLGKDFFGIRAGHEIERMSKFVERIVVSDAGFQHEVEACMRAFPKATYHVWRIAGRGPQDFAGDSRQWLRDVPGVVRELDIHNTQPGLESLETLVRGAMKTLEG